MESSPPLSKTQLKKQRKAARLAEEQKKLESSPKPAGTEAPAPTQRPEEPELKQAPQTETSPSPAEPIKPVEVIKQPTEEIKEATEEPKQSAEESKQTPAATTERGEEVKQPKDAPAKPLSAEQPAANPSSEPKKDVPIPAAEQPATKPISEPKPDTAANPATPPSADADIKPKVESPIQPPPVEMKEERPVLKERTDAPLSTDQQQGTPVAQRLTGQDLVEATFKIQYETKFGEQIAVAGNIPEFGCWDSLTAFSLKWTPGHIWEGSLRLPYGFDKIEYKYICRKPQETQWEAGENRTITYQQASKFEDVMVLTRDDVWGQTSKAS